MSWHTNKPTCRRERRHTWKRTRALTESLSMASKSVCCTQTCKDSHSHDFRHKSRDTKGLGYQHAPRAWASHYHLYQAFNTPVHTLTNTNTGTHNKIDNSTHRERELAIAVGIKLFENGWNCPAHADKQSVLLAQAALLRSSKNVFNTNGCSSALFTKPGRGEYHLEAYDADCCRGQRRGWHNARFF